jgi:hypothetical protein
MSNLIKLENGVASVVKNEWQCVELPASDAAERVQAG